MCAAVYSIINCFYVADLWKLSSVARGREGATAPSLA